jgi:hypothetical protein
MSGERRFNREQKTPLFRQTSSIVIIVLLCAFGLFLSLAVFPSHDSWTPTQLLASP